MHNNVDLCMLYVVACVVVGKILDHQSTNLDCLLLLTFGFEFGEDGLQGPRGTRGFFTQGKDGQSSFTGWVKAYLLQHFGQKIKLLQKFLEPLLMHGICMSLKNVNFGYQHM